MPSHSIESLAEQNAELRRQIDALEMEIELLYSLLDGVVYARHPTHKGEAIELLDRRRAALATTQEGADDHADTD